MSGAVTLWFTITTVMPGVSMLLLTVNIVMSGAVVIYGYGLVKTVWCSSDLVYS